MVLRRKDPARIEAYEVFRKNREDATRILLEVGQTRIDELLHGAHDDLLKKIARWRGNTDAFTLLQLKTTMAQIRAVSRNLGRGIRATVLDSGISAADKGAGATVDYLLRADRQFRGVGTQPLALREAAMIDAGVYGVRSSILSRLASSGEPVNGADKKPHPAKIGILQRYDMETIGFFERRLQRGLLARKSHSEMEEDLREESPFLRQAPAHWARRIVRTEIHAAYSKASWETIREADNELGDMVKILSAVFDDRISADSVALHGQIRRPDEPFEWWDGEYMHPPNRPNDREIVVPHRIAWPIPKSLAWRDAGEIAAAWKKDGRKGSPPERPLMTTVPLASFGQGVPEKKLSR